MSPFSGTVPARGEVDEPLIEVLHERADLVDLRHAPRDTRHRLVQPLLNLLQLPRLEVASVARDPGRQRSLLGLELDERAAVLDELFGHRTHPVECLVRLLGGEVAKRHVRMITAVVSTGQRL